MGVALPWARVWDWSDCPEDIAQNATREARTAMAISQRNVSTRRGGGGGRFSGIHRVAPGSTRGLKRGISKVCYHRFWDCAKGGFNWDVKEGMWCVFAPFVLDERGRVLYAPFVRTKGARTK